MTELTAVVARRLHASVDDFSQVGSEHPATVDPNVGLVVDVGHVGRARARQREEVGSISSVETDLFARKSINCSSRHNINW